MDPHPSQQHAGLQHAVWWPYQEVTRPKVHHSVLAWDYYFHLTRMVVGAISSFLQRQNYEPTLAIFSRYWVNFNCWKWPNIERQNLVIWSHCRFSRFKGLLPESSVPILGYFFNLWQIFEGLFSAWPKFEPTLGIFVPLGIFSFYNKWPNIGYIISPSGHTAREILKQTSQPRPPSVRLSVRLTFPNADEGMDRPISQLMQHTFWNLLLCKNVGQSWPLFVLFSSFMYYLGVSITLPFLTRFSESQCLHLLTLSAAVT